MDAPYARDSSQLEDSGSLCDDDFHECLVIFLFMLVVVGVLLLHVVLKNTQFPARLPFVFLVGWACGKALLAYVINENGSIVLTDLVPPTSIHLLLASSCFFGTTLIDYHTFSRNMFQVFGATMAAFLAHIVLVTAVAFPILEHRAQWSFEAVVLMVATLSSVQVDNTLSELKNVNAQLRKLHLLLQGEKVLSILLMAYVIAVILKFSSPSETTSLNHEDVLVYSGWLVVGALPGLSWGLFYRYPLSICYSDIRSQTFLALVSIPMCYFFSEFLGSSGPLSVIVFGIAYGCSKAKISNASEKFFKTFWEVVSFGFVNMTFLLSGLFIGTTSFLGDSSELGFVMVFYGLCLISRMLAMSLMGYFFVAKCEWIPWKHYAIALYGVYKGSPNLTYVNYIFIVHQTTFSYSMAVYVSSVVLLSHLVNVSALRKLLNALGMYDLTQSRVVNMDGAVTHVNHCREKAIMSLKMDRIIADANWLVVDQATKLRHPYSRVTTGAQSKNDLRSAQVRLITCAECSAESVASPTKKELIDITMEAKHKILKAQMMSFWKQNESGTLSDHSYRILTNLVETASVRNNPTLSNKDLKILREGSQVLRNMRSFLGFLSTVTSTTHSYIPTNWLRALCFRLCSARSFQITLLITCLIDLSIIFDFLLTYYFDYEKASKNGLSMKYRMYEILDGFFFLVFFAEFIILCLGISVVHYFHSNVNKIEFATGILLRPTYLIMIIDTNVRKKEKNIFFADPIIMSTKALMLMRFARILIFLVALIPNLLNAVNRKMDDDLIKAYDIGKGYIIALDKVIKFLSFIVENEVVYNQLVEYMESERRIVTRELGMIQKDRPTVGGTLKTRHAIRHVINTMSDCAAVMKEEGMLDLVETLKIQDSILIVKKRIRTLVVVNSITPELIIKEVPWIYGDQESCNLFWDYAVLSSYSENEIIIHHGDDPVGLFVIVSGLVHCVYKPDPHTTQIAKLFGILPNYDFFMNHQKLDTAQEDYIIGGGNVIGEIGIITGRRYDMTVTCETAVQLYYIPWNVVRALIYDSSIAAFVRAKIWKAVAIKIGVNLLPYTSRFQGWSREKLLLYLQRGFVPVLAGVTMLNINPELIEDVFVIEGVTMDMATRSTFVAPIMVPRTVQKLLLPESSLWDFETSYETQLLVILSVHALIEDVMSPEGIFKGNFRDKDTSEKSDDGEIEGESFEEPSPTADKSKSQKCHHDRKNVLSPKMLLELRKKKHKKLSFMEYSPTLTGALEESTKVNAFALKTNIGKKIRPSQHSRNIFRFNLNYTQDVLGTNEIESLVETDLRDVAHVAKRLAYKTKAKLPSIDAREVSQPRMSTAAQKIENDAKITEVLAIKSESDEEDNLDSKSVQTFIQMVERRGGFFRSPRPPKRESKLKKKKG